MPEFACQRCGACCRVPGLVRLRPEEPDRLAACLGMDTAAFIERHTRLTPDRRGLSLKEQPGTTVCEFLDTDGACRVQAAKPLQCRDFPGSWTFPGWEQVCAGAPHNNQPKANPA